MTNDQRIKVRGRWGWLRWSPRGYWTIRLENFTDHESLEERFLHPESGDFDTGAIEAAKERLLARAREHFKKKKERK